MKAVYGMLIGLLVVSLVACSRGLPSEGNRPWYAVRPELRVQDDLFKETKALTVWSYFDMTALNKQFLEQYPGIHFSFKQFPYEKFAEAYTEALLSGNPPDVMVIDNGAAGTFQAMRNAFDNVLEPPYSAHMYVKRIPGNLRGLYLSLDGEKQIGFPQNMTGAVMFYREDLFRAGGLPVDPESLAVYLEEAEHWLEAAQRLKEEGHVIFQWDTDPLYVLGMQENFFDENFHYMRNTAAFGELLEVSRSVHRQGLSLRSSIWTRAGQEALRTGELAAVYMGSWGIADLEGWAPDTSGKWRATRLPMGLYGIEGGSFLAFPAESKNKYLAWEYAKLATMIDKIPDFSAASDFLGGQDVSHLFRSVPYQAKPPTPSPFDAMARHIWEMEINDAITSDASAEEELDRIQAEIEAAIEEDRRHVLRYLQQEATLR